MCILINLATKIKFEILRKFHNNKIFNLNEALEETVKTYHNILHFNTEATPIRSILNHKQ